MALHVGEKVLARLLGPLLRCVLLPHDDETQAIRKKAIAGVAVAVLIALPMHLVPSMMEDRPGMGLYYFWTTWSMISSMTALVHLMVHKHASEMFTTLILLAWSIGVALADLHSLAQLSADRSGMTFIIVLDLVLVSRLPETTAGLILAVILAWIFLTEVELTFRFGLLDIPGSSTYDERRKVTECAAPPCSMSVHHFTRISVLILFVYILDFTLTRRFARQALGERDKMSAAVRTTNDIARCFARFDLTRASAILAHSDLPGDLSDALCAILDNLVSYQPYLPSALFDQERSDSIDPGVPGWNSDNVAIVFTDVRQSTALWEHSGAVMRDALETHNHVIRSVIEAHGGYEIKTIGDAFMAAFPGALDAVCFGLRVQTMLAEQEWPEDLGRGADDGHDTFMVRIGVHFGAVSLERNPLTGRYDYFGSTVNKAARVEANGAAGAVTVTAEVLEEVREIVGEVMAVPFAEPRVAKGFEKPLWLTALLNYGNEKIASLVRAHCGAAQPVDPALGLIGSHSKKDSHHSSVRTISLDSSVNPAPLTLARTRGDRSLSSHRTAHVDTGTVCALRLNSATHIVALGSCLGSGQISSVFGSFVFISWGAHRTVPEHLKLALQFLGLLSAELDPMVDPTASPLYAGLATGRISSMHLAASPSQRFLTVTGPCVDLAMMLCNGAAELGTSVLAASVDAGAALDAVNGDPALPEIHLRPVDTWCFVGGGPPVPREHERGAATATTTTELVSSPAVDVMEMDATPPPVDVHVYEVLLHRPPEAWVIGDYARAFRDRDTNTLRRHARVGNDQIAMRACRMLESGTHLTHAFTFFADMAPIPAER